MLLEGNLAAHSNGVGRDIGGGRIDVVDGNIVVIQRELEAVVGIPVHAQRPDILLAAGNAAAGGAGQER